MEFIEVIDASLDLNHFINHLKKHYPQDQLNKSIIQCYRLQGLLDFVATTTINQEIRLYCLITISELNDLIDHMWNNVEDYLYE